MKKTPSSTMARKKNKPERSCGVRRSERNATRETRMGSPNSSTESSPSPSGAKQPARGKKVTKGKKTSVDNSVVIPNEGFVEKMTTVALDETAKILEINDKQSGNDESSTNNKQKGNDEVNLGKEKSIENAKLEENENSKTTVGDAEQEATVSNERNVKDKPSGNDEVNESGNGSSPKTTLADGENEATVNDEVVRKDKPSGNESSSKTIAVDGEKEASLNDANRSGSCPKTNAFDGRCVAGKTGTTTSTIITDSTAGGNGSAARVTVVDTAKKATTINEVNSPPRAIAVDRKETLTTSTVVTDSVAEGSSAPNVNRVQMYNQDTDDLNILEVTGSSVADLLVSLKVTIVMINERCADCYMQIWDQAEMEKYFKMSVIQKRYNWNKIQSVVMRGLSDYQLDYFALRTKFVLECEEKLEKLNTNRLMSPANHKPLEKVYNNSSFGEDEMPDDALIRHVAYNNRDMFGDTSMIMLERGLKYHSMFDEKRAKSSREYVNYWKNYGKSIISIHPAVMQMNRYKWQYFDPRDMKHSKLARDFSTVVKKSDLIGPAEVRYGLQIRCDSLKNSSGKWTKWAYLDHHTPATNPNLRFVGVLHASKVFLHHHVIGYIRTHDELKKSNFSVAGGAMPKPQEFETDVNPNRRAKEVISIRDGCGLWRAHQIPCESEAQELYMGMHLLIDVMELAGKKYLETEADYIKFSEKNANCEETEDGYVIARKRILLDQPFICLYRRPGIPKRAFKYSEQWAEVPLKQRSDFVVQRLTNGRSVSRVNEEIPAFGKDDDEGSDWEGDEEEMKAGKRKCQSIPSEDEEENNSTTGSAKKSPRKHRDTA